MNYLSYDQLPSFAQLLAEQLKDYSILTITGSMGTGKTTLVQHLLAYYQVPSPILSPTYAYVIAYTTAYRTIYHFDLYRLGNIEEFLSLGFDEYFADPQALIIIEWPEVIKSFLANYDKKYAIALDYHGIDKRLIITP